MNNKSLGINSVIYLTKTVVGLVLPIITYPYITRRLQIETIGKVNFSLSIVNYFSLIAGLGIYTFAVRSGSKIRDNANAIKKFSSEVFTINILTTIIAYILFVFMLIFSKKCYEYRNILLVISISIPLTTLGVDWIFTIYEEYFYITIRTIFVQVLSLIFLLIYVRNDDDIYWYAIYTVFANVGSNVFNFFRSRQYVKLYLCFDKRMLRYLKPILLLFASAIATQLYLNSDITILGYMTSDKDVGLYNSAVKVYNVMKSALLSFGTVGMPRLAYQLSKNTRDEYDSTFTEIFNIIVFLAIPCSFGLAIISNDIMIIFAGRNYYESGLYLRVLSFACPFSVLGSFLASGCLVLFGKENKILFASIVGAVLNIILNIFLIPKYGPIVAAMTTFVSEIVTVIIHIQSIKCVYEIKNVLVSGLKSLLSGILMLIGCIFVYRLIKALYFKIMVTIITGISIYFLSSIIFKNPVIEKYKKYR